MNSNRYVGDSKLHEMIAVAMEENWDVCKSHIECIIGLIRGGDLRRRRIWRISRVRCPPALRLHLYGDDAFFPSSIDQPNLLISPARHWIR